MMSSLAATATLPGWARAFAIVVGIIALIAAAVVLLFPGVAILTLVFFLALALLFIGIDRLISGITGHPYSWMMPMTPPSNPPGNPKTPP
jgi:uncharacterized membrane protein HdeD (DUF308 family)